MIAWSSMGIEAVGTSSNKLRRFFATLNIRLALVHKRKVAENGRH